MFIFHSIVLLECIPFGDKFILMAHVCAWCAVCFWALRTMPAHHPQKGTGVVPGPPTTHRGTWVFPCPPTTPKGDGDVLPGSIVLELTWPGWQVWPPLAKPCHPEPLPNSSSLCGSQDRHIFENCKNVPRRCDVDHHLAFFVRMGTFKHIFQPFSIILRTYFLRANFDDFWSLLIIFEPLWRQFWACWWPHHHVMRTHWTFRTCALESLRSYLFAAKKWA